MSYLGSWKVDDLLTFPANTHRFDTGAGTDADAAPDYRVYEDETGTAILTGSMAKLDDANTVGFYTEQITLSAANGFEKGKCYTIYVTATVNSVAATMAHTFQIEAEVDANIVSDKTGYALSVTPPTAVQVRQEIDSNSTQLAAIVADTNELETDWSDGGRLDLILDARASQVTADAIETDTQDIQSRLPAALVLGRMDSNMQAAASGVITAAVIATGAIDADAVAADAVTEIQSGLATAASIAALNNLSAAQVNAEVVDALATDTYAELAAVPAATSSLSAKINWIFALARNKLTQTATTQTLRNDADSGSIGTAAVSDDGTTATRAEWQ